LRGSTAGNVIDAAAAGASNAISLVANIAANLIAFWALLQFINSTLTWFGQRVGIRQLTYQGRQHCHAATARSEPDFQNISRQSSIITGSIARSASRKPLVFNLLRGRF